MDSESLSDVCLAVLREAGVGPVSEVLAGVEVVQRGDWLFAINHTSQECTVAGETVAAGDVRVIPAPAAGLGQMAGHARPRPGAPVQRG